MNSAKVQLIEKLLCIVLLFKQLPCIASVNSTDHLIDDESHDPFKDICKYHEGEYYRETAMKLVCCGNDTLKLPDAMVHYQSENAAFAECSQKFSKDDASDFPTGMWKTFLCKLRKSSVFKSKDKITFGELMSFITQFYPANVTNELKKLTSKCTGVDNEKISDHLKIEKYMGCYYDAENKTCHKPNPGFNMTISVEDFKKTKDLGCSVVPGLVFASSIEYCCKKRTTPYAILEFPGSLLNDDQAQKTHECQDSFAKRERELVPEAFNVVTPKTEDGEDHTMHTTWDILARALITKQKNYTSSMLKLDSAAAIEFFTHDFGKKMKSDIKQIIDGRMKKEKIFLAMDVDSENSKPMTYDELSKKFVKAPEKEKLQYYCKFIDTIAFEERRALHEYCFNEKYGNEWGDQHHSFFVPQHK